MALLTGRANPGNVTDNDLIAAIEVIQSYLTSLPNSTCKTPIEYCKGQITANNPDVETYKCALRAFLAFEDLSPNKDSNLEEKSEESEEPKEPCKGFSSVVNKLRYIATVPNLDDDTKNSAKETIVFLRNFLDDIPYNSSLSEYASEKIAFWEPYLNDPDSEVADWARQKIEEINAGLNAYIKLCEVPSHEEKASPNVEFRTSRKVDLSTPSTPNTPSTPGTHGQMNDPIK